jgi:hypothetical protein
MISGKGQTMEMTATVVVKGFQGGEGWIGKAQKIFRAVELFCVV